MSEKLTGQLLGGRDILKWEMRWPRYKIKEIADKSPEAMSTNVACQKENSLVAWPDVSCQTRVEVFIKAAMFRCKSRSRLTVQIKRSLVNSSDALIISTTLSVCLSLSPWLHICCKLEKWRKWVIFFIYKCSFFLLFLSSPAAVCNAIGGAPGTVYDTGWKNVFIPFPRAWTRCET